MADEKKEVAGGDAINLKCKMTTQLSKLMNAFCQRQGVQMNSVRFLFDGQRLTETQTPQQVRVAASQPANTC
eukprot:6188519-Pleurochrysis_carterae.AAC.3